MVRRVGTNKKLISIGIVCLLVIGGFLSLITFESNVVNAPGITIYVDDDNTAGPWDGSAANPYKTIQDGVNNSNNGDTVFVLNGHYTEHVIVDKTINLIGQDMNSTTIDGGGIDYKDVVLIIVDGVSISGFSITNSGIWVHDSGIEVNSNNNTIYDNKIYRCFMGIFLNYSNYNNIFENTVVLNMPQGIHLNNSNYNNIIGNNVSNDNKHGIILHYSDNNIIKENKCNSNYENGITFFASDFNIIENNTINSNEQGILFSGGLAINENNNGNNIQGNIISYNNWNGIWLISDDDGNNIIGNTIFSNGNNGIWFREYCDGNNITGNTIFSNGNNSIYLRKYSNWNKISDNNIYSNKANGINLFRSNHTEIKNNNISMNNWTGIRLFQSHDTEIINNNISMNNETGIILSDSHDNKIKGNIVSNNTDGIFIDYFYCGNNVEDNIISLNSRNGIWIDWYAYDNNIKSNNISNNLIGINISTYSENNDMNANNISNNLYGAIINSSDSNTFIENAYVSNTLYAINIESGEFNIVYHNYFIDNNGGGIQAKDNSGTSGWYATYPNGGNYWNDWTTPDIKSGPNQDQVGSDGFVDFPYYLDGGVNAMDRYPYGIPEDFSPPEITNLQPPDGSIINDSTPTISANYSDPSGIDVGSVVLTVNGTDVTLNSTVTATGVNYLPATPLSDGIYTVYIEVQDIFGYLATETWSFTVDATPPEITNLQPPDTSIINDNTPTIGADYTDPSDINTSSVVLKVDNIDITASAIVTASDVTYLPLIALSEGIHTVYLEVKDIVGNRATATWSFTVDTLPPVITNLQPPDASMTNNSTPVIGADYSDPSGIDVGSVVLEVDGVNVTLSAVVTASGVNYIPGLVLPDGIHTVYLEVKDIVGNLATVTWSFTVDTTPPMITNLQPPDNSTINNSTPTISADYSDPSGINASSVLLEVDGIDVTSSAMVTANNVTYIPGIGLADNVHTVNLQVEDIVGNHATVTWSFTVDTTPPTITNLKPPDASIIGDSTPTISADYSDQSGINVSSVVLEVDGIDVTVSAIVTASGVSYVPSTELSDGIHTVYLEVKDNVDNLATLSWSFTVDSTSPIITNLKPPDGSIINDETPLISANYSDLSGINISSVVLTVNGIDVTSFSIVTESGVSYIPGTGLSDGIQSVYLEVADIFGNLATVSWTFTIDTTPPVTTINPNSYYIELGTFFSLTATDGPEGSGVYYTQYKIDNNNWKLYFEPFSIDSFGHYNITYRSVDNVGNIENENILSIYNPKGPITKINIGVPQFGTTPRYVNYSTQFSFSVIDYSGTGFSTHYSIDASSQILYPGPFTVSTEGPHTIYYFSIDNLGNVEKTNEFEIIVDNTPPTTTILFEEPSYRENPEDILNVTSATPFVFSVADLGLQPIGYDYTEYRIWNSGVWSEWFRFSREFNLEPENGTRYIEWYSIDKLGNKEITNNLTVFVDNIPPVTDYILQIEPDNSEARISLISNDVGSGVDHTRYRIGSEIWRSYSSTFLINEPGQHTIYLFSLDNLGNSEEPIEFSVVVEDLETTQPDADEKEINYKPLIALIFTIILLIVGSYVSYKRPLEFRDYIKKDRLLTWLFVVLPFAIAEIFTGIISLMTGLLSVPPLIGLGMFVDLGILFAGLITFYIVYRK
jgi:parallel beta-helix repeat protein